MRITLHHSKKTIVAYEKTAPTLYLEQQKNSGAKEKIEAILEISGMGVYRVCVRRTAVSNGMR